LRVDFGTEVPFTKRRGQMERGERIFTMGFDAAENKKTTMTLLEAKKELCLTEKEVREIEAIILENKQFEFVHTY
jgi:hypothetical protein